jgi:1,4-dihydroxy-2-naphthoyl-CoA hydrolase
VEMTAEQRARFDSPFDKLIGIEMAEGSADRAASRLTVGEHLFQPGGVVHGGVYATLVEHTASIGANLWLDGRAVAVGVANHTDFLHAVRAGELTAVATPLQRGRRLQLWQVLVTDADERLVAHGTVKLANLPVEAA